LYFHREEGFEVKPYRYYDANTCGLNYGAFMEDVSVCSDTSVVIVSLNANLCSTVYFRLQAMPEGSAVLLHACAHNPTGVDLSQAQWKELAELFKKKNHLAFIDMAYQVKCSASKQPFPALSRLI
jgi:aspartate aminotransferase, mitochondrial